MLESVALAEHISRAVEAWWDTSRKCYSMMGLNEEIMRCIHYRSQWRGRREKVKWDISDLHKVPGPRMQLSRPHGGFGHPTDIQKGGRTGILRRIEPKYNFYSLHPRSKRDGDHLLSTEARSLVTWWANTMIPISSYNGDLWHFFPRTQKIGGHKIHPSRCKHT